jgi:hypothetical protein
MLMSFCQQWAFIFNRCTIIHIFVMEGGSVLNRGLPGRVIYSGNMSLVPTRQLRRPDRNPERNGQGAPVKLR